MEGDFTKAVIEFYQEEGRNFFWREKDLNSFQFLILEMLLKRTRAETVDNHSESFLETYSSPAEIRKVEKEKLEDELRQFGLQNRRSKNMKNAAEFIIDKLDGDIPQYREDIKRIPGVADYIADAVLCFSFSKPVLVLDSNVAKVANFYFNLDIPDDLRGENRIRNKLESKVPEEYPKQFNWGLIDLENKIEENDSDPLSPYL